MSQDSLANSTARIEQQNDAVLRSSPPELEQGDAWRKLGLSSLPRNVLDDTGNAALEYAQEGFDAITNFVRENAQEGPVEALLEVVNNMYDHIEGVITKASDDFRDATLRSALALSREDIALVSNEPFDAIKKAAEAEVMGREMAVLQVALQQRRERVNGLRLAVESGEQHVADINTIKQLLEDAADHETLQETLAARLPELRAAVEKAKGFLAGRLASNAANGTASASGAAAAAGSSQPTTVATTATAAAAGAGGDPPGVAPAGSGSVAGSVLPGAPILPPQLDAGKLAAVSRILAGGQE